MGDASRNGALAFEADEKGRPIEVVRFVTSTGTPIFLLPVETFPGHRNNIYVVLRDGEETLFDVGSGMPASNAELDQRFDELRDRFDLSVRIEDLKRAVVSHAHIDHFGGVHAIRDRGLPIWIHELDARVLSNFEERITVASKDIGVFLRRGGLDADRRAQLTAMYTISKQYFSSITIDRSLRDGEVLPGEMEVYHVPGHCPGLICLRIDDILLASDHVLSRTTPNQTPQSITPFTGLENYLRSLEKITHLKDIQVTLGGHEAPVYNLNRRIVEIGEHHRKRLAQILDLARDEPKTIVQLADELFGLQKGYGQMLAYTEAGAHVEYLNQLGKLGISNLEEVAQQENPVLWFQTRE
jgi:glyoxylase-like metal-dependent hydrolase (beta-lactamase superfamily II)